MNNIFPTITTDEDYNVLSSNNFTTKKNLKEVISFSGNIMDFNEKNVLSYNDPNVCYKIYCTKENKIFTIILIDISEENIILRQTSHGIKNVGNTINSFLYLSKELVNPKMILTQLKEYIKKII